MADYSSKIPLNLKHFKHVKSDDKTTTLRHIKEGHSITLVHKALAPEHQAQLAKMNEPKATKADKNGKKHAHGGTVCMACGGPVQKYAEGKVVEAAPEADPSAAIPSSLMATQPAGLEAPPVNPGIVQNALSGLPQSPPKTTELPPEEAPPTEMSQQAPSTPMEDAFNNPEQMIERGLANQMSGVQAGAEARGQLGQAQSSVLQKNIEALHSAQETFQKQYDTLDEERKAHIEDIQNGHVDPNKYWTGDPRTGDGGHSRIATAIGMIIAGFNPTNHPNAAIEMLNHQMDMNLEAQKQNLSSKQNLLAANLRQFGNAKDALEMTRLMQNDTLQHELAQRAAQAQSPIEKANAQQAIGQLQQQAAPIMQQFAIKKALISAANGASGPSAQDPKAIDHMLGYLRVLNPEAAKEMETRYVPGVGMGSVPVSAEVRNTLVAKQDLQRAVSDMRSWAATHSGDLNPKDIATGKTMAANVQNLYRGAINGGVFKKGEQDFIDNIVDSDPTAFFNSIRVLPKLDQVLSTNAASSNVLRKNYGLPAQAMPGASKPGVYKEGQIIQSAQGHQLKVQNGKWVPVNADGR